MGYFSEFLGWAQILALIVTVLAIAIVWYLILPLSYWRRKGIPHVPAVPFFGSIADSMLQRKTIAEDHDRIYRLMEGNRYAGYQKLVTPSIMIRDPELLKTILIKDFSSFHDNDFDITPDMDPMAGRSIFFMHGEPWKRIRTSLSPAFASGKIKSIMPLIKDVCDDLVSYLETERHREIELKDICSRFTTNVVASCAFGIKTDALRRDNEEFRRMGSLITEPSPSRALVIALCFNMPTLARILGLQFITKECTNFFRKLVWDIATERERTGDTRNDILHMLLMLKRAGKLGMKKEEEGSVSANNAGKGEANNENGVHFTKVLSDPESLDDVTAQTVGFFVDGFETSSILLSFALLELAYNQHVQERLRAEIEMVLSKYGGNLTYEAIQEMPYLDMVVKEALRKYPPAPFNARRCTKRYRLPPPDEKTPNDAGGFWLEPGTSVLFPIYSFHRDPKNFPNPDVFDPDRFAKDENREERGLKFIPFGGGPRMCIGNRFATTQSKAAIVKMVTNFKLKPFEEKTPMPIELDPNTFLLHSKRGFWVKIEKN